MSAPDDGGRADRELQARPPILGLYLVVLDQCRGMSIASCSTRSTTITSSVRFTTYKKKWRAGRPRCEMWRPEPGTCRTEDVADVGRGGAGEDQAHGLLPQRFGFRIVHERIEFLVGFELRSMLTKRREAFYGA